MSSPSLGPLGRLAATVIAKPRRSIFWIVLVSIFSAWLATGIRVDPNMLRLMPQATTMMGVPTFYSRLLSSDAFTWRRASRLWNGVGRKGQLQRRVKDKERMACMIQPRCN